MHNNEGNFLLEQFEKVLAVDNSFLRRSDLLSGIIYGWQQARMNRLEEEEEREELNMLTILRRTTISTMSIEWMQLLAGSIEYSTKQRWSFDDITWTQYRYCRLSSIIGVQSKAIDGIPGPDLLSLKMHHHGDRYGVVLSYSTFSLVHMQTQR